MVIPWDEENETPETEESDGFGDDDVNSDDFQNDTEGEDNG